MKKRLQSPGLSSLRSGFTVIELMASMGVVAMIMLILISAVDSTRRVWSRSTSKISQYQAARAAFESLTRNLSQATLNTYYGLEYDPNGYGTPVAYYRESDLHFVSGKAAQPKLLNGSELIYPTHAVFFQAPLGMTSEIRPGENSNRRQYGNLNNLLTAVGYYIEFGEDKNVPDFLADLREGSNAVVPKRNRFRLMEVIQPAESLGVFATSSYADAFAKYSTTQWIQWALGNGTLPNGRQAQSSAWVRAENIVALIILPKLPERDRTPPGSPNLDLAPDYEYDSRPADPTGTRRLSKEEVNYAGPVKRKQFNQLPPVVQVVMVAIDEPSAVRQEAVTGDTPPDWTSGLFTTCRTQEDLQRQLGDPRYPSEDSLVSRLAPPTGLRMDYRIYTADVVIRGAKWTTVD